MANGTPTAPAFRRARSSAHDQAAQLLAPSSQPPAQLVISGHREADVVRFESELVTFFVDAATLLGVPKSVAAVYGIVFASPEPLSFSEISARLNFSNGSVSQALRALREIGAIRKATYGGQEADDGGSVESGGRTSAREWFVPDLELRKLVGRFLEQRLEKQLNAGCSRLDTLKSTVPTGDKRATTELSRRLKSLSDWHTRARQLLPVARTILRLTP